MAKIRTNHKSRKRPFAGLALRVFLMLGILGFLFVVLFRMLDSAANGDSSDSQVVDNQYHNQQSTSFADNNIISQDELIPANSNAEIVKHTYYTLGYNERYEQAEWVSYKLTRDLLKVPNVPRAKRFTRDPLVSTISAEDNDYRGSGYSRGHMAPAGDMAQNETAMQESFFMSNMSPQKIPFNGGIWRELEECVRDWTYKNEELYIVTGPILNDVTQFIGRKSKVGVPKAHYKVILDPKGRDAKAIAFIMPNEKSDQPIMNFAVSVDEVEERTGLDFFANLLSENEARELESSFKPSLWPISKKRQNIRINNWNNR